MIMSTYRMMQTVDGMIVNIIKIGKQLASWGGEITLYPDEFFFFFCLFGNQIPLSLPSLKQELLYR
jgi:hypothetical protein